MTRPFKVLKNDPKHQMPRLRVSKLRTSQKETYRKALDAIQLMRSGQTKTLTAAAREAGTTSPTVRRYAGSAFAMRGSKYRVKPSDRLRRELAFYNSKGKTTLVTHSSRQATQIATYHNAVKAYLIFGDDTALRGFDGKSITVHGTRHPFLTDRRVLSRLARAGELNFLEIYASDGVK